MKLEQELGCEHQRHPYTWGLTGAQKGQQEEVRNTAHAVNTAAARMNV